MGTILNVKQVNAAGVGVKPWIPLKRIGQSHYSLNVIITGTATVDIEGTLMKFNQAANTGDAALGPPAAEDVFLITNATALTASVALNITDTPLEAIRANQTAGTGSVSLHVMAE